MYSSYNPDLSEWFYGRWRKCGCFWTEEKIADLPNEAEGR